MKKKHIQLFSDGSCNFLYAPVTQKNPKLYKIYTTDLVTLFLIKKNTKLKNLDYLTNTYKNKYII